MTPSVAKGSLIVEKSMRKWSYFSLFKLVTHDVMVSVSSFKSSSIQHDVHLVNYGPI